MAHSDDLCTPYQQFRSLLIPASVQSSSKQECLCMLDSLAHGLAMGATWRAPGLHVAHAEALGAAVGRVGLDQALLDTDGVGALSAWDGVAWVRTSDGTARLVTRGGL